MVAFVHPQPPAERRLEPLRRALWVLPLLLGLVFVAAVLRWARSSEAADREAERQTLIADALSTEAQLRARLNEESVALRALAAALPQDAPNPQDLLARQPLAQAGLGRMWRSVTWLDASLREQARLPQQLPGASEVGLSLHLVAPAGAGQLVVRYDPALLLKRGVPWWLARKYDVQLVDSADQLVASLAHEAVRLEPGERPSYRVTLSGPLRAGPLAAGDALSDAALELILREPQPPLLRPLAWVLMGGFVLLSALASWLLRAQMRRVMRAEAAWRTEANWRAAMEDSALVGLRARDAEGRLLSVNRTFCEMTGWPAEDLLGRAPPMPYWPPDAIEAVMQRHQRNLAGGAPREGYEARWVHRDGRELDVLIFESPLLDAAARQVGWMGSILDVTERKRSQEREQRQVEAQAQAARLTMLGEVASTLAHELNQPLTAIASYNAGVLNSLKTLGVDEPRVLTALQRLGEQAAQAGRVVQRIRQFLTRREPQLEPCALAPVVASAAALLAKELKRREVGLELALDAQLPEVQADAVLLEQVLINLLRNAAEALGAQDGPRRIRIEGGLREGRLRVAVLDNGPGLAVRPERLFEPFYSSKSEGMGMGLAICRSIVEAHRGQLRAWARPEGGAGFEFELPLHES